MPRPRARGPRLSLLTSHARFPERVCRGARGNRLERVFGRFELGSEPALIANRDRKMSILQDTFERMKNFRPIAERFGKSRRAARHDHELLEIDRRI